MPGAWRAGSIEPGMTGGWRGGPASGAAEGRLRILLIDELRTEEILHFKEGRFTRRLKGAKGYYPVSPNVRHAVKRIGTSLVFACVTTRVEAPIHPTVFPIGRDRHHRQRASVARVTR